MLIHTHTHSPPNQCERHIGGSMSVSMSMSITYREPGARLRWSATWKCRGGGEIAAVGAGEGRHLQRDHHLVRPPHALRLPGGVRRRHEHRRPVVHDLKADAQRLAAHVARRARGGQREDALVPVARQHVVAALQLRSTARRRGGCGGSVAPMPGATEAQRPAFHMIYRHPGQHALR